MSDDTSNTHGMTISLVLGERLPCECCHKVEANTVISLPSGEPIEPMISSLIAHAACQLTLIVRAMAPEMPEDVLGSFLATHIRAGVTLAVRGGESSHG